MVDQGEVFDFIDDQSLETVVKDRKLQTYQHQSLV